MELSSVCLPDDLFASLKCDLCEKYLSVGPVLSLTDSGKPYKCGRCKDIPSEKKIRNLCYEKVAEFLTFPCSYESCNVKLSWNEIESHEKNCQQRIIRCVNHNCPALVKICDIENHFRSHTKKRVYFNRISKLAIKKQCSVVLLLKILEDSFFVVIRHSPKTVHTGVFSLQPLSCHTLFNLVITSDSLYFPSVSYKAKVIPYDELEHCINCMRKKCHLVYHKFSENYDQSGHNIDLLPLTIDFEALEDLLFAQKKPIYYSVNILLEDINNQVLEVSSQSSKSSEVEFQETSKPSTNRLSLTKMRSWSD